MNDGGCANKDHSFKHISNIRKNILNLLGKFVVHLSEIGFNRNDVEDQQKC